MVCCSGFLAFQECLLRCKNHICFTMWLKIRNQRIVLVDWVLHGPSCSMPPTVIDLTVGTSMSCHACNKLHAVWKVGLATATSCKHIDLGEYSVGCGGNQLGAIVETSVEQGHNPCASSTSILRRQKIPQWLWFPVPDCYFFAETSETMRNDQGLLWGCRKSFSLHDAYHCSRQIQRLFWAEKKYGAALKASSEPCEDIWGCSRFRK